MADGVEGVRADRRARGMSVVISAPRRLYVILLFWQQVADACSICPRSVARLRHALGGVDGSGPTPTCEPVCRIVMRLGLHRVLRRRLIGFSVLVLDPDPAGGRASTTDP